MSLCSKWSKLRRTIQDTSFQEVKLADLNGQQVVLELMTLLQGQMLILSSFALNATSTLSSNFTPKSLNQIINPVFMKHLSLCLAVLLGLCASGMAQYSVTVESSPASAVAGQTVYRFYVDMQAPEDELSAVYGNSQSNLIVNTPDGVYNSAFNASWSASGINPIFLTTVPELADDTYATIGLDGPASTSGLGSSAEDPSIVQDPSEPIIPYFLTDGATSLSSTGSIGSSWYVTLGAPNARPQDENLRKIAAN